MGSAGRFQPASRDRRRWTFLNANSETVEADVQKLDAGAVLKLHRSRHVVRSSARSHLPRSAAASCVHRSDQGAYFVKM